MNAKTKIKICRTVIEDVCKKYENTREFIHNKINELCSEHGISADEARLYIFMFVMPRTQFGNIYSLERICFDYFCIRIVLFRNTYKDLKQHKEAPSIIFFAFYRS